MEKRFQVWIDVRTEKCGELWTAYCDDFGISSCGTTQKEAENNLANAFMLLCQALAKRDLLETRLTEKKTIMALTNPI